MRGRMIWRVLAALGLLLLAALGGVGRVRGRA